MLKFPETSKPKKVDDSGDHLSSSGEDIDVQDGGEQLTPAGGGAPGGHGVWRWAWSWDTCR